MDQKVLLEVVAVTAGKLLRPLPLLRTMQHLQTAPLTDDTFKFSPGNCLTRSYNGTFVVSLFPLRLQFPLVDSKDRSRVIVEGTGLCSPSEFPSMSC